MSSTAPPLHSSVCVLPYPRIYYLLGKRKHRHPEGVSLVEEAVRPSRKWVFTLLVEGPQRSLEGRRS